MKQKYIESLLSEIKELEVRVTNLKKNQKVPFSFFKESFEHTQEIAHLLHKLEFVQIEDMKAQMEKLVHFLSETESEKENRVDSSVPHVESSTERSEEHTLSQEHHREKDVEQPQQQKDIETNKERAIPVDNNLSDASQSTEKNELKPTLSQGYTQVSHSPLLNNHKETIVDHIGVKNKSLNDVQTVENTLLDTKRNISLNDRFLFQRELFNNNREAMNEMLSKLQSFSSFEAIEEYLKENTDWDFRDETVEKFIQMLKNSIR